MPDRSSTPIPVLGRTCLVALTGVLIVVIASTLLRQSRSGASRQEGSTPIALPAAVSAGPFGDAASTLTFPGTIPQDGVGLLWRLDIPDGYVPDNPVVAGNRLVVSATSEEFGTNLIVHDLRSGEFLWNYATDGELLDPFVTDGVVLLTEETTVRALSLETGEHTWDVTLADVETESVPEGVGVSKPIARSGLLVVSHGNSVIAMSTATGEERWRRTFEHAWVRTPIISGDQVLVVSQLGSDTSPDAVRFHSISLTTGNELWRVETDSVTSGGMEVSQSGGVAKLSGSSSDGSVGLVVDGSTGKVLWEVPQECEPVLGSDIITHWFICFDGEASYLDPHTGEPLADPPAWADAGRIRAVTSEHVLVAEESTLAAFDRTTGERLWAGDLALIVSEGSEFLWSRSVAVGNGALVVELFVEREGADDAVKEIVILGDVPPPAATPSALATPGAADATPAT